MDLEDEILAYLASKKIFHYRQTRGVSDGFGGYRIGAKGGPNIICVIEGQYVAIAVKSRWAKQTDSQKQFQEALEAAGGKYMLVFSVDDVKRALGSLGASASSQ